MEEINRGNANHKGSGFFDLPEKKICSFNGHKPPMHLYIPQGKGYRHICPECGRITDIIPQQIMY